MQNLQLALSLRSEKKTITLFITKIVTEYKFLKENIKMKKGIHPENYRPVVFKDMSNGDVFLSRSTCNTKETIEFEGETYPLVKLEIIQHFSPRSTLVSPSWLTPPVVLISS